MTLHRHQPAKCELGAEPSHQVWGRQGSAIIGIFKVLNVLFCWLSYIEKNKYVILLSIMQATPKQSILGNETECGSPH